MNNIADSKCIRCIIVGKVQGVFFRASTQKQAQQLGIVGYAKNLSDGSVEVMACGLDKDLEKLKQWLHIGPRSAQVINVECEPAELQGFMDFRTY